MRCYLAGDTAWWAGDSLLTPKDFSSPQARLVLSMLATHPGAAVTRDAMAEELWPDRLPRAWDVAVRAIVSKLRHTLRPGWRGDPEIISSVLGGYQLRPANLWVDTREAAAAIHRLDGRTASRSESSAVADALAACMITGRPFLVGFDGPWVSQQRRRLSDIHVRAREILASHWLETGDAVLAIRDAEAATRIDPYREPAHQLLIRSHIAAGNRPAAVLAFAEYRDRLARDLDLDPSAETVRTYRSALRQ